MSQSKFAIVIEKTGGWPLRKADPKSPYLTPVEAAALLRVSAWTVYQWLKAGKLQGVRFGNTWRIPRANVLPEGIIAADPQ